MALEKDINIRSVKDVKRVTTRGINDIFQNKACKNIGSLASLCHVWLQSEKLEMEEGAVKEMRKEIAELKELITGARG
jgi:hypothetical protein